jgi:predicted XRE-type DNA-binding protein
MPRYKNSARIARIHKTSSAFKYEKSSGNVFKDLGFRDDEANKKMLKCQLMLEIEKTIKANKWTQAQAAERLSVVQPRISEIMTTRIERFTIDMLLKYLNRLGKYAQLIVKDYEVA